MILIPKGYYEIGTDESIGAAEDQEGPKKTVFIDAFYLAETTVTNQEFQQFCDATGYITESEKFGWSFVFHYFLDEEIKKMSQTVAGLTWWYGVAGANWRQPEGPNSTIEERMAHPVVQVSRNDAVAYCQWAGRRLPTEAEWEIAAKGGTSNERYPWGNEFLIDDQYRANIWQGKFPIENTLADGFSNTAPAKYYEPNASGFYQMIGNVWEWCVNSRGLDLSEFNQISGQQFWNNYQKIDDKHYAIKGGSFLCHQSYCNRYRIAARNGNTGMSASNNMGFRCAKDCTKK